MNYEFKIVNEFITPDKITEKAYWCKTGNVLLNVILGRIRVPDVDMEKQ
jgi:hypothetical protein